MNRKILQTLLMAFAIINCFLVAAQKPQQGSFIDIKVYPKAGIYNVSTNEQIDFEVVVYRYGMPIQEGKIDYQTGTEKFEGERKSAIVKNGKAIIKGGKMKAPGFYKCHVYFEHEGKEYYNSSAVGVNKDKIEAAAIMPDDFLEFWKSSIDEAGKTPLEPILILMPEKCTDKANVYHISYNVTKASKNNNKFYGVLSIPKASGKYPAKIIYPGAGIRPYHGDYFLPDQVITLQIGIHGIPVNLYESSLYEDLYAALGGYYFINRNDRDYFYYKRVVQGCIRAIDFIYTLPEFDGETVAAYGGKSGRRTYLDVCRFGR